MILGVPLKEGPMEQELFSIPDAFPDEVWLHVFNSLAMQPEQIVILTQVSTQFRRIAHEKTLWQKLLDKYFPHVRQAYYQDYLTSPLEKFKKEYQRLAEQERYLCWNQRMSAILATLCGDLSQLTLSNQVSDCLNNEEADCNSNSFLPTQQFVNTQLLIRSLANGNYELFSRLDNFGKRRAFELAAKNGNLSVVEWFFLNHEDLLTPGDRALAYRAAMMNEHLIVASYIEEHSNKAEFGDRMSHEKNNFKREHLPL